MKIIDIIKFVSVNGWVMKFLPDHRKIVVDFYVVISGIEFRQSGEAEKYTINQEKIEIMLQQTINRLKACINSKLPSWQFVQ